MLLLRGVHYRVETELLAFDFLQLDLLSAELVLENSTRLRQRTLLNQSTGFESTELGTTLDLAILVSQIDLSKGD